MTLFFKSANYNSASCCALRRQIPSGHRLFFRQHESSLNPVTPEKSDLVSSHPDISRFSWHDRCNFVYSCLKMSVPGLDFALSPSRSKLAVLICQRGDIQWWRDARNEERRGNCWQGHRQTFLLLLYVSASTVLAWALLTPSQTVS